MHIIFSFIYISLSTTFLPSFNRSIGDGECKDVTVGDCVLDDEDVVLQTVTDDAILCQFLCNSLTDCTVFQFSEAEKSCILLTEDYRQDCKTSGGPEVKNLAVNTYNDYRSAIPKIYINMCRYLLQLH